MQTYTRYLLALSTAFLMHGGVAVADPVRIAEVSDVTTFDPHMATDKTTISINEHIFEGLIKQDETGAFVPSLAESWKLHDDGLTWTFELRQDVKFTDGTPFDAAAAQASFDRILDPKVGAAGRARLNGVESIRSTDPYTIEVVTKYPWPELLNGIAGNSTRIISPKALSELGDQVSRQPVGTGPFTLKAHKSGQEVQLSRNQEYWGEPPVSESVIVSFVPEGSTRSSLIQAGEVDIAVKINPENVAGLDRDANVEVIRTPSTYTVFYMFNLKRKPFDDPRVREALNLAIDREAIINGLMEGAAQLPRGIFAGDMQYKKELDLIPYDPDRARELLKEAAAEGLKLKMWSSPRYLKDREVAQAIQAYLRQVGVDVEIDMADWGTHWSRINEPTKDADLYLLATTIPEPTYRIQWNWGRSAGGYWGGYGDEELWAKVENASKTVDEGERAKLFGDLQEEIWNDYPYLFLYERVLISAKKPGVEGFRMDGREIWDLTKTKVK